MLSGPLPSSPAGRFLFIFLSSLLFSLFFLSFFFFPCYFGRALNARAFPSAVSRSPRAREETSGSYESELHFVITLATGVSRVGCLIALARGSGIVLFHGLTAKWSNIAIGSFGRGAQRTYTLFAWQLALSLARTRRKNGLQYVG